LLERVQTDIVAPRTRTDRTESVALAIDLIEIAIAQGMPDHLGARWLARIAQASGALDLSASVPEVLKPDHVARRILHAFGLTRAEALEEAARRRRELIDNDDAWLKPGDRVAINNDDVPADLLRKLEHLMFELVSRNRYGYPHRCSFGLGEYSPWL
jgi:hypothetical protein